MAVASHQMGATDRAALILLDEEFVVAKPNYQKAVGFHGGMNSWKETGPVVISKMDETRLVDCRQCGYAGCAQVVIRNTGADVEYVRCPMCKSVNLRYPEQQ
jgi:DNA-directed RNA polymerase subunit RPC12/RpoP